MYVDCNASIPHFTGHSDGVVDPQTKRRTRPSIEEVYGFRLGRWLTSMDGNLGLAVMVLVLDA